MPENAVRPRARSLAEDLRARDDAALQRIMSDRPDLLNPVPSDIASLAARAGSRPSVQRVLDRSNQFVLQVVDALCVLPEPVDSADVIRLVDAEEAATRRALTLLRDQGLVYGDENALSLVRAVRDIVGAMPGGLGQPMEQLLESYSAERLTALLADLGLDGAEDAYDARRRIAGLFADPEALRDLLSDAPPEALEAARALSAGQPWGRIERARRPVRSADVTTPVDWLLARAVVVATDDETVVLPREVGIFLRSGRIHAQASPSPPELDAAAVEVARVDRTAAGAAFAVVRKVEDLLELWSTEPPKALRAGGLGVRERTRAAAAADLDEDELSLLIEVSHAAGLVGISTAEVDEVWLPTSDFDTWLKEGVADRWLALVTAWLETTRVAGLVGSQDSRGRTLAALGPELERVLAPEVRRAVLESLAQVDDLPSGRYAAATPESVMARLAWHAPRRGGRLRDELVRWTLAEAELLGVTGHGAVSSATRLLLAGERDAAADALEPLLPTPHDHVVLQADLTAVATGPLSSELSGRLRLLAEVESTGGATVYRFREATVRRALDAGMSADEITALLARHSRTPVPQPLTYLVHDVARRHGQVRAGVAASYVRCDDDALVSELASDRRCAQLRLRRLAPTVLVAQAPVDVVLGRLRELGYVPAAEGADGGIVVRRPDSRRAPPRRAYRHPAPVQEQPKPALLLAAVRALRAGDRAATAVKRAAEGTTEGGTALRRPMSDILATLQEAVASGNPLWVGYVNAEGQASQRVVEPIGLEGGYLSAYDHLRQEVRTFLVHRITGVSAVEE